MTYRNWRAPSSGIGLSAALWLVACLPLPLAAQSLSERYDALIANVDGLDDPARLHALFDLQWQYELSEYPESATFAGVAGHDDRWTDKSLEAVERRRDERQRPVLVLESIDRNALSASDLLNYELFAQAARIELMGQGIESGITQPAITVRDVPKQVLNLAVADVEQNSFYAPFLAMPTTLAPEVAAGLRRRGEEVAARFNRPGPFLANTYDLRARLIWEMEALTLHEAVPGNGLESRSGDRVFSRQFE